MVWVGTSGFQYPEWKGKFYPADLSTRKMLESYAGRFNTTESNYTFRRVPSVQTLQDWAERTPSKFRFSLKAPQEITHRRRLRGCTRAVNRFWAAAQHLGRKLGPVLFQLPPFLRGDIALLGDFLQSLPRGVKAAFEFRHESWFNDEVFGLLKHQGAALCIADSETLHTPALYPATFAYYRLRDESYRSTDIRRWAKTIQAQPAGVKDTFVYFKHEQKGLGPGFALELVRHLGESAAHKAKRARRTK